ncbi:MAG: DUF4276 family protein [Enhygromyxa sp.]
MKRPRKPAKRSMKLFVEGANTARADLRTDCREAFHDLFERAGIRAKPRVEPRGSRREAFDAFCAALQRGSYDQIWLLVDSEGPVSCEDPWEHVRQRQGDGWIKPDGAIDDHLHLMVEVMETWFLADPDMLEGYFKQGFRRNALPKRSDIENISKVDIDTALRDATKDTKKGRYDKGKHSFDLLRQLDPEKLKRSSQWAFRLLQALDAIEVD